jgi:hypothetical protein
LAGSQGFHSRKASTGPLLIFVKLSEILPTSTPL